MAMSWGQSSDLWSPLAVTVIGGLLSATMLTLFVLPNFILITEGITEKIYKTIAAISRGFLGLKQRLGFSKP